MAKAQGKCIFCEGAGLTKEHVFPKWARRLLTAEPTHVVKKTAGLGSTALISNVDQRQGYIFNRRLRVVCGNCNSGWMSQVESKGKDVLARLISGETISILGKDDQAAISIWSCLRTAVFETDHPTYAVMLRAEYDHIFRTHAPPAHWRVLVCRNVAEDWQTRIFHWGGEIAVPGVPRSGRANAQRTLIGMGNLAICISSSTLTTTHELADKISPRQMHQIFPYRGEIDWDSTAALGSEALTAIANWSGQ